MAFSPPSSGLGNEVDYGELAPATIDAIEALIDEKIALIDSDDISDIGKTHKFTTEAEILKLAGIDDGTASPTGYDVTNVAAFTVQDQQWIKVGNTVTVSGRFTLRPISAGAATELGISLPIGSVTDLFTYVSGTANFSDSVSLSAGIEADIVNNRIAIRYVNTGETGTKTGHYNVTYRINT